MYMIDTIDIIIISSSSIIIISIITIYIYIYTCVYVLFGSATAHHPKSRGVRFHGTSNGNHKV